VLPKLAATLKRRIDRVGLRAVYELELRVSHAVAAMEERGVAVHRDRLEALIEVYTEKATRLKAELAEEWGINPGSSKQLREYFDLDEREGWPKTAGSAPSMNQDTMHRLLEFEPSVATWIEWKEAEKIRSTYGKSLLDKLTPEGRIHARFKAFGTATGRFSSSSPHLQNIPKRGDRGKQMRGLFWSGSDDRVLTKGGLRLDRAVARGRALARPLHARRASAGRQHARGATAAALFNVKPGEVTKEQNSQTHHERFPGLERALKAPLREVWRIARAGAW
jgi:DNA polymerase-1